MTCASPHPTTENLPSSIFQCFHHLATPLVQWKMSSKSHSYFLMQIKRHQSHIPAWLDGNGQLAEDVQLCCEVQEKTGTKIEKKKTLLTNQKNELKWLRGHLFQRQLSRQILHSSKQSSCGSINGSSLSLIETLLKTTKTLNYKFKKNFRTMLSQSTKATMYSCIQLHVPQAPLSSFSNKKHTFDSCITSDAAPCNLCMHSSKSKIKVENQTIKKNFMTIQYNHHKHSKE